MLNFSINVNARFCSCDTVTDGSCVHPFNSSNLCSSRVQGTANFRFCHCIYGFYHIILCGNRIERFTLVHFEHWVKFSSGKCN